MSYAKKQRRKTLLQRVLVEKSEPTHVLSVQSLAMMRELGLLVSSVPQFPPNHSAYPNGYLVSKPLGVLGNSIPGYEVHLIDGDGREQVTDAPSPVIYSNPMGGWSVSVHEYVPGPGPGDFDISFTDEPAAVDAVIRFLLYSRDA